MGKTSIEWCDKSWGVVRGCKQVSPGCTHCYAMRMAHRFSGKGKPYEGLTKSTDHGPVWTGRARFVPEMLEAPLHWRKPARIFANSMSDLFHDDITNEQIAAVFGVMAACPQHTFLILTKRPSRMMQWFRWINQQTKSLERAADWFVQNEAYKLVNNFPLHHIKGTLRAYPWPLPNVWLGVSAENQLEAENRIEFLVTSVPAAIRFVSLEPLLGPIDLENLELYYVRDSKKTSYDPIIRLDALRGYMKGADEMMDAKLDLVIVGCESGPGARPMDLNWVRSLRDQCVAAKVSFFFKQAMLQDPAWPSRIGRKALQSMPELDGKVWAQFPGDAR